MYFLEARRPASSGAGQLMSGFPHTGVIPPTLVPEHVWAWPVGKIFRAPSCLERVVLLHPAAAFAFAFRLDLTGCGIDGRPLGVNNEGRYRLVQLNMKHLA